MNEQLNVVGFADHLSGQRISKMDEWGVPTGLVIAKIQDVLKPSLLEKIQAPAVFLVPKDAQQRDDGTLHVLFFCRKQDSSESIVGIYSRVWISDLNKEYLSIVNSADDAIADHQSPEPYYFAYALANGKWPIPIRTDKLSDPVDLIPAF
ncbi:MAG TPA: hypothetical protein VMR81_03795 [Patescibacteria group bacterium]|jgi:hypothetical protein|nr:hypothetical protein [Patescibacteria group bacterium]